MSVEWLIWVVVVQNQGILIISEIECAFGYPTHGVWDNGMGKNSMMKIS
jgi:hypothetical protein